MGVEAVDAADSKRRDIRAAAMLLCSNTGFDDAAIRKAKRTNIGLVSALKQGDERIKGTIQEEIFLRKVNIAPITYDYHGISPADREVFQNHMAAVHDVTYEGGSVAVWLQQRAMLIVRANPTVDQPLTATFNLKTPMQFAVRGHHVMLRAITIRFQPHVQWLSQTVSIDAKAGIYDYVHGRVVLTPGENQYVIRGVDFDTATPIPTPPDAANLGVGLGTNEIAFELLMVEGLDIGQGAAVANLTPLVREDDLSLVITSAPQ